MFLGRGNRGFSLLELMVALGLAFILSAVAVPGLSHFRDQYQLAGAGNQLAFDIARARMQAVGQSVFMRLGFAGDDRYALFRSTDGVTYAQDGPLVSLPNGVKAVTVQEPTFNRNGIAPAATTVVLRNREGTRTLRTNVLGRVTIS